jgi:TonB family protein
MRVVQTLGLASILIVAAQTAVAQQVIKFDAVAEVEVRADGTPRLIQVFNIDHAAQNETAQNRLKGEVARRITQWKFSPAKLDGTAVDAHTFVWVGMEAQVNADGNFTVRVTHAGTGPRASHRVRPGYPEAAARSGAEGIVVLLVSIDEHGRIVSTEIEHSDASPGSGTSLRLFEAGAMRAAKLWRYDTETAGGKGVAARIRLPIEYCMVNGSSWCSRQTWKQPDHAAEREMVTLDPAVKLLTDVREQGI